MTRPQASSDCPAVDVTHDTFTGVADDAQGGRWLVLVVRVPAEPSRHRVAVWRELRRTGAVPLGQGCWAVPDVAAFAGGITRAAELAERGEGEVIVLNAPGRGETDAAPLTRLFTEAPHAPRAAFPPHYGKSHAP